MRFPTIPEHKMGIKMNSFLFHMLNIRKMSSKIDNNSPYDPNVDIPHNMFYQQWPEHKIAVTMTDLFHIFWALFPL